MLEYQTLENRKYNELRDRYDCSTIDLDEINRQAQMGWRVVAAGFNDEGEVIACLMERPVAPVPKLTGDAGLCT
jgi:hypothetical protein